MQPACLQAGVRLRYDAVVRALLFIALAGCQQVFGLEEAVLKMADAGIDAPGCADADFVDPQKVAGSVFGNDFDPHMSSDPLELWFSRSVGVSFDIHIATRTSETGTFDNVSLFVHNDDAARDFDANTTADGLVLVFASERLGQTQVFQSRRASKTEPFSAPLLVQSIPQGEAFNGIDLSFDGLTIYYANGDAELRTVQRGSLADSFGDPSPPLASGTIYPSVSPDELELFYQRAGTDDIFRRTRTSTMLPFDGAEELIFTGGVDPDISSDSTKLFFADGGIYMMTRVCN